jgi:acyl-CoA synthetase (NDP forming)
LNLDFLFRPKHVAVIGASRTPGKLGHSVLRNLLNAGYSGRVSAINPVGAEVEGQPGFRSIGEVGERVDCAFLAIPAASIPEAVSECAKAGVRSAILGAAGFAELGTDDGIDRQKRVAETARAAGMRLVGPNTNGILSTVDRLSLGYNASHGERHAPGSVSIISHSGALMDGIARRLYRAGGGLSKFVAAGNEADLNMLDYVEYLIDDESTKVIGLVIEALSDGARFLRLCRKAGKPIIALKIGRSALGAEATLAHSSRLAGSARAYEALFREAGVAAVPTVEALAGGCALLAAKRRSEDRRIVCFTTSGAGGAILADFAAERGMPLAGRKGSWEEGVHAEFSALKTLGPLRNPIDMGSVGGGDWSLMPTLFEILERNGLQGPVVAYTHMAPVPGMDETLADGLIARNRRCPAPVMVLSPGGLSPALEARYAAGGIHVYHDTAAAFDSLACWYCAPPAEEPMVAVRGKRIAFDQNVSFLDEHRSAEVLRAAGVAMVRSERVGFLDEAKAAAAALGYPVVLKGLAPGVAHKNEYGLVAVGLRDPIDLEREFNRMKGSVEGKLAFLVQPMVRAKAELIAGVTHEKALGHFLVFGLGGVHTEVLDAVTLLPIPTGPATLRARLAESPVGRLVAAEKFAALLDSLQALVLAQPDAIDSIDLNPVLATADDCLAVDALIVLKGSA